MHKPIYYPVESKINGYIDYNDVEKILTIEDLYQENQKYKEVFDKSIKFIEDTYYSKNTTDIDNIVLSSDKLIKLRKILKDSNNQQSLGVLLILSKSANYSQYWKGETMKEVYWKELLEIFESDEELKINHETLYKNISLIVKANDTHKELEELNKELTELNK